MNLSFVSSVRMGICSFVATVIFCFESMNLSHDKSPHLGGPHPSTVKHNLTNARGLGQCVRSEYSTFEFKDPPFQNEAKCTTCFICMRMKNHFHIKGSAVNLALIQRPGGTRKWLINFLGPSEEDSCGIVP